MTPEELVNARGIAKRVPEVPEEDWTNKSNSILVIAARYLPKAMEHIDTQAAQNEALKEKLIQERGKYIAVYEEDEWDFDDLPELDAREYIRTAHQQLKAEMPEVGWE